MPTYLLDTNILSDLIRNPAGKVAVEIAEVGEDQIVTSIIVAAELRYGAAKRASPRLTAQVEAVLSGFEILPLQTPVDFLYGKIRAQLQRTGKTNSANDLLIAAHALSLSAILVTGNTGEFEQVDGLKVENWLG